jgi:hypothetical protein
MGGFVHLPVTPDVDLGDGRKHGQTTRLQAGDGDEEMMMMMMMMTMEVILILRTVVKMMMMVVAAGAHIGVQEAADTEGDAPRHLNLTVIDDDDDHDDDDDDDEMILTVMVRMMMMMMAAGAHIGVQEAADIEGDAQGHFARSSHG